MTAALIAGAVVVLLLILSSSGSNAAPSVAPEEPKEEEAAVTPIKTNRRLQQALKRKERELELREDKILQDERKLELSFKELSIDRKSIANAMQELVHKEQESLFKIKGAMQSLLYKMKDFDFSKREFNDFVKGKELNDYERSIKFLEQTNNEKFRQKTKDLDQQQKEFNLNIEVQRNALNEQRMRGQAQLTTLKFSLDARELQQIRKDISQDKTDVVQTAKEKLLKLVKNELTAKKEIIEAYEAEYFIDGDEELIRTYNKFGFELKNPVIEENKLLRRELRRLHLKE